MAISGVPLCSPVGLLITLRQLQAAVEVKFSPSFQDPFIPRQVLTNILPPPLSRQPADYFFFLQ